MNRRSILGTIALAFALAPIATRGQSSAKMARVGYLALSPREAIPISSSTIVTGLADLGYVEGKNLIIEFRNADTAQRLQNLAAEMIATGVQVIIAPNPYSIRAARAATTTVPIVGYDLETDPVAAGYVASLARPGGNVTGVFLDQSEVSAKQLQLLKEMIPGLSRVAVLWDDQLAKAQRTAVEDAGRRLGVSIVLIAWAGAEKLPESLRLAKREGAQGLIVLSSPRIVERNRVSVADAALTMRLPAVGLTPNFAKDGLLLTYGPIQLDMWRVVASMVARILNGALPADIPIEKPSRFALAINVKSAKAIGIAIPRPLLLRADEILE